MEIFKGYGILIMSARDAEKKNQVSRTGFLIKLCV